MAVLSTLTGPAGDSIAVANLAGPQVVPIGTTSTTFTIASEVVRLVTEMDCNFRFVEKATGTNATATIGDHRLVASAPEYFYVNGATACAVIAAATGRLWVSEVI